MERTQALHVNLPHKHLDSWHAWQTNKLCTLQFFSNITPVYHWTAIIKLPYASHSSRLKFWASATLLNIHSVTLLLVTEHMWELHNEIYVHVQHLSETQMIPACYSLLQKTIHTIINKLRQKKKPMKTTSAQWTETGWNILLETPLDALQKWLGFKVSGFKFQKDLQCIIANSLQKCHDCVPHNRKHFRHLVQLGWVFFAICWAMAL
jgi:hypothetical protein